MSNYANRKLSFLESLAYRMRSVTFTYQSRTLSKKDRCTIQEAICLWCCLVGDLLSQVPLPKRDYQCTLGRIITSLETQGLDVLAFVTDLGALDDVVIHALSYRYDVTRFKHEYQDVKFFNQWLKGVVTDIMATISSPMLMWRTLHQLARFPQRIYLSEVTELTALTEAKYFDNLDRVAAHTTMTMVEQSIITRWLDCCELPTEDDCCFGTGATSDVNVKSIEEKYTFYADTARSRQVALKLGLRPTDEISVRPPHSRLIFVPKSVKINRPIAAEDPKLMYFQQGIFRVLNRVFRSTSLSRRISLENQARSRQKALIGSTIPSHYATIDLSSASDSVRTELVNEWFRFTSLGPALRICRSTHAVYEDKVIPLPMYASMGSALCFPIECLCFAAMCEATIMSVGDSPEHSNYCVYGDDIIIESKYATPLIERLEYNGFLVNTSKSYYEEDCYFREACGGEYAEGYDVTPLYLSRRFSMCKEKTAPMSSALAELANACFSRGFFLTRSRVISLLKERYKPYFSDDISLITNEWDHGWYENANHGSAVYSPTATNYHLKTRYDRRLYRRRWQCSSTVSLSEENWSFEAGRLLYALHKPLSECDGGEPSATARVAARTRLSNRLTWRLGI